MGTPVFLTVQSLVTFPGSSLAVLILWKTLGLLHAPLGASNAVPILISLGVGALIYYISLAPTMTRNDKLIGAFLALLNSCYVALFVIGVPLTIQSAQAPPAP